MRQRSRRWGLVRFAAAACLSIAMCPARAQQSPLVISEFMAVNSSTLRDADNKYSDWIEIQNLTGAPVSLAGWSLTDRPNNPRKWLFPATNLAAHGVLVVFASGEDRAVAGQELHTNFELSGEGEYLALIHPTDTNILSAFAPAFPAQSEDISYGRTVRYEAMDDLVGEQARCLYQVPASDADGAEWTRREGFDDAAWTEGFTALGYDAEATYADLIATDLDAAMRGINPGCYLRMPFVVTNATAIDSLLLVVKYDDGFVAYLNGQPVAAANAADPPQWNSTASAEHPDALAVQLATNAFSATDGLLVAGTNILAIHAFTREAEGPSADFLILPVLRRAHAVGQDGFLPQPSPGLDNLASVIATTIQFSPPGGSYTGAVHVSLSAPVSNVTIRFTTDGSIPGTNSPAYTQPILVGSNREIRAQAFVGNFPGGLLRSAGYIVLAPDALSYTSSLPVVVLDNFGVADIPDTDPKQLVRLTLFEPVLGRTSLTNQPTIMTRAGIRRRGESTLRGTNAKPNLGLETWGEASEDRNISLLGMPAESDWVLHAPWEFDLALLRHAFAFQLCNETGEYAVRTRFVEVFLKVNAGPLNYATNYYGVYVLMERAKQGDQRVDIEALTPSDNALPALSGGYMFKSDKPDPEGRSFTGGSTALWYVYPSPANLTTNQAAWLKGHLDAFGSALYGPDFRNPATGYTAYIDADNWVAQNIMNVATLNIDWPGLSAFFYKPRNGKIHVGPMWDVDRALESTDGRDDRYDVWTNTDWNKFTQYWWDRLFDDPDFWQKWVDRWQVLREDTFGNGHVLALIDSLAAQVAEAQARNFQRWPSPTPRFGGWQGEVDHLKTYVSNRFEWISAQFPPQPVFTPDGNVGTSAVTVTLACPAGYAVYYTTDGTDPRAPGGLPAPGAVRYTGAFTLPGSVVVTARTYDGLPWAGANGIVNHAPWSGPRARYFLTNSASLACTEVMYHPRLPSPAEAALGYTSGDFEFIEFKRLGSGTGSLLGTKLVNGILFDFTTGAVPELAAGEHVVVVRNLDAFKTRYPNWPAMRIAGQFSGGLSAAGESVELREAGAAGGLLIVYRDGRGWPAEADGAGHSLVPLVITNQSDALAYGGHWRASAYIGGSPGNDDPTPPPDDVAINEVMAHTDFSDPQRPEYDSNDWLELFNRSSAPVPLAGWYLSDDAADLRKWPIPAEFSIPARGWLCFDEVTGFHAPITNGFGLNKAGEQIFLSHLPGTAEDRVADCLAFKGQENGASLGRYADGDENWYALSPTPAAANAPPAPRVVISRILYHPAPTTESLVNSTSGEYVEIENVTTGAVPFWTEAGTWRLDGGISYAFPTGFVLDAGAKLLVVPFAPSNGVLHALIDVYGPTDEVAVVLGPWAGQLSDRGERVALELPLAPDLPGDPVSWVIVDEVIYSDRAPWPEAADGTGAPLVRAAPLLAGADPAAWQAGSAHLAAYLQWSLDDGDGLNASDRSGHGRTGSLLDLTAGNADGNTPPAWSAGHQGGGLLLDGIDDTVRREGVVLTNFPFTLAAWVRTTNAVSATVAFLGAGNKLYNYYSLGTVLGKPEIAAHVVESPLARQAATATNSIADGQWHYLSAVFLSATGKYLYVDGALAATLSAAAASTNTINRFSAGVRDVTSPTRYWKGSLDSVTLFVRGFTPDDVRTAMGIQPDTPDTDEDGLPDAWEQHFFGGPSATNGAWDADADGDLLGNYAEYLAGTDPTNALDVFEVRTDLSVLPPRVVIGTLPATGAGYEGRSRHYDLDVSTDLLQNVWWSVPGASNVLGTGAPILYTPESSGPAYYRGRVRLTSP